VTKKNVRGYRTQLVDLVDLVLNLIPASLFGTVHGGISMLHPIYDGFGFLEL
jgi:hypothetical protein